MPLGLGIVEALRAIPPRIEVTGHGPTVRITAGSFDAVLDYARECYDAPAVLSCDVRHRFWPRITLTVTTDPELAGSAPPLAELRRRAEQQVEQREAVLREPGLTTLEEIFDRQERQRQARIPAQRQDED